MNREQKGTILGKRVEGAIGLFLLIPPFLGVIAFTLNLFGNDGDFASMTNLSRCWVFYMNTFEANTSAMSSVAPITPIYLALMAMVGAYLIKDSLKYFFIKLEKPEEPKKEKPKPEV